MQRRRWLIGDKLFTADYSDIVTSAGVRGEGGEG